MKLTLSGILVGAVALSACSTTGTTTTTTPTTGTTTTGTATAGSGTVSTDTDFVVLFNSRETPNDEALETLGWSNVQFGAVNEVTVGGVDFVVGTNGETAYGYSGVRDATDVGTTVLTGTATYTSDYKVVQLSELTSDGTSLSGRADTDTGIINLTADFDGNTLTGNDGDLNVLGTLIGGTLSGAVTYGGVAGSLNGSAGSDGVAGAFHGSNATTVYAGGFVGPRD
ncbi:MAG: hypothetical protein VX874_18295 [Pseudomonadota bacterium]|nr:hypothetical protein [Pseudomonadota bacterium]